MAVILGIPLIKGNSQEIVSTRFDPANYGNGEPATGLAQSYATGGIEPDLVPFDQGRFLGFAVEINNCANTATVIRAGISIPVRSQGAIVVGDTVFISTSGFVVAPASPSSFEVNGTIEKIGVNAINGQTGVTVTDDVVLINLGTGRTTNATA